MPSSSTSGKFMSTRSGAGARGERGGHDRRRVQACAAEKAAKEQQLRIWRGYVPPVSSINSMTVKTFDARVVEIISGDCISVVPTSGQDVSERRINLSSIRAPRISNSRDEKARHEPWAIEAKEFLISRLIGQVVSVNMDYARKIGEGANERTLHFATVKVGTPSGNVLNVAELLLVRGFAACIRHRSEEERAADYDDLIAAEKKEWRVRKGCTTRTATLQCTG